ncbi:MAG: hypothetical protein MK089_09845 [Phycisphaerales bacterium]|nr:hypothetical protein [Phycisphaerales bacterium]
MRNPSNLSSLILAAATAAMIGGCNYLDVTRHWVGGFATGADVMQVAEQPRYLPMTFATAVCGEDPYVDTSVWMTDLSNDQLESGNLPDGQIMHVELLFTPRPGWTPIDATATNLAIRYILITNGEVGIYEGGGFGFPIGSGSSSSMTLRIEGASMQLSRSTVGFVDLLSPAELSGTFSGPCNTAEVERVRNIINQHMTNTFGQVMYVDGGMQDAVDQVLIASGLGISP